MEKVYKFIFLTGFVCGHETDACHKGGDYGYTEIWF